MLGGYGSDWTRRRYSETEGKSEICTELATTLSKSTTPQPTKVRRLSFARHASVIESTTGTSSQPRIPLQISKTFNFRHQTDQEAPTSFKDLIGEKSRSGSYSSNTTEEITTTSSEHDSTTISLEVQSILDGSSKKPFHMANFECFLQDSKKLDPLEETNSWLIHASVMVAFLLEFRSYAEMFARIPAHEKTASPHPFDIICIINSGLPHNPSHPSLAHTRNDERRACFDEYYKNHSNEYPTLDTTNSSKHSPVRKVNWAASVRSYSTDRLVEPTSISQPYPSRSRRAISVSCSNISSAVSSVLPDGLNPESQPMRSEFDGLIQKYLGSRNAWDQAGGLLSQFDELKSDLMTRALLEAKYTNHPAVLAGLVEFILQGLNQHVIPIFMEKTSDHSKKNKGIIAIRMVAGLLILLSATILELILIILPSPLAKALEIRTIPRWFRLTFLPLFVISTLLISMDRFNICCFTFWSLKSSCVSCLSRRKMQGIGGKLSQSEKQSLDNMEENLLGKNRSSEPQKAHEMKKNACWWILTSLVLTLLLQTTFLLLPATHLKEK
ncbi:uncharacterized protein MELLADRAFT_109404 [Melampsora larici-populina 98AG31]|uniref:RGS domain-containing protein n=1 Tax=Melampsora larici-populina (strain 98AG31 / pathotype 3-4-7) TaxID=747676 RepID=F4RWD0_MELLP|nr:uncharacterized protein MELLADRAFT_109404 [Melampsora larici-populina 98AG31]EGG03264.1 hypothetical protein MELLADRAFT_109404 [Melampsora larici-populina 98AG31]